MGYAFREQWTGKANNLQIRRQPSERPESVRHSSVYTQFTGCTSGDAHPKSVRRSMCVEHPYLHMHAHTCIHSYIILLTTIPNCPEWLLQIFVQWLKTHMFYMSRTVLRSTGRVAAYWSHMDLALSLISMDVKGAKMQTSTGACM